jgi:23S rRNA (cytidine1920-2'-O)/16S rRNA (cytidine1409-2'-O)-methyltransferase
LPRLDVLLTRSGLIESRRRAHALILAGKVKVSGETVRSPDRAVRDDAVVTVDETPGYASRGALKLMPALDKFDVDPSGRICADIGASTGGFTDVLLRRGAKAVTALDVGYGQLILKLREDPRVTVLDRMNIRLATPADLPHVPELVTIDTSFISLRLVIPAVLPLVAPRTEIIALIKPQFEVGKGKVGKGGIVRDEKLRREAVAGIVEFAESVGLDVVGTIESPIEGAAGNREYLALMKFSGTSGK